MKVVLGGGPRSSCAALAYKLEYGNRTNRAFADECGVSLSWNSYNDET